MREYTKMSSALIRSLLDVLSACAVVLILAISAVRLVGKAKRSPTGAGAVGWALLFLGFGRMPPPPPASQIELQMNTEKDRLASRDAS